MTNRKRTVIFLWNYLEWGGAQIYFLAIIKEVVKNWNVKVVLPKRSSTDIIDFIVETGAEYELIDTWLENSPAPGVIKKIKRQWRRIHAEIVSFLILLKYPSNETIFHIETAPWQSWLFLTALMMRGNVFVTVHNAPVRSVKWREMIWKLRLRFLSKFKRLHLLTANREAKEVLQEFVANTCHNEIKVTYASINPVETEKILAAKSDKHSILGKQQLPSTKFTILCVGQFIDRKGRWIFLESAEKLLRTNSDLIFVWLMPKLPDFETQTKIDGYELKNSFYPVLSSRVGTGRRDILEFINTADLFVLPSLLEGLPISLLEAMALKKACVTSDINSIPEAVKHLETGWLIKAGSVDDLSMAISSLKNDQELRNHLAVSGHLFVRANFDERKMAQTVIREYESCFN